MSQLDCRFDVNCSRRLQAEMVFSLVYIQLRTLANGRLPFYEVKVLFSEGRGRM